MQKLSKFGVGIADIVHRRDIGDSSKPRKATQNIFLAGVLVDHFDLDSVRTRKGSLRNELTD